MGILKLDILSTSCKAGNLHLLTISHACIYLKRNVTTAII